MKTLFKLTFVLITATILTSCDTKIADMLEIMERSNIICVDQSATGTGTGETWENACTSISQALTYAKDGGEIWVAGPYQISTNVTLGSDKNIILIGGFDGNEEAPSQTNGKRTEVILGSDCRINLQGNITFEDFEFKTINRSMFMGLNEFSLKLKNCKFEDCSVDGAGGVLNTGSVGYTNIEVYNCIFEGCNSTGNGGVFYINTKTSLEIISSKFIGNHSDSNGGVIYVDSVASNVEINISKNCYFEGNYASAGGGAISCGGITNSIDIESDCVFENNYLSNVGNCSGGVINSTGSHITISDNCRFKGNYAYSSAGKSRGGVFALFASSVLDISNNCDFFNNYSSTYGGVISSFSSNIYISNNCHFENNSATDSDGGGVLYTYGIDDVDISGNYFYSNMAGGIINSFSFGVNIAYNSDIIETNYFDSANNLLLR